MAVNIKIYSNSNAASKTVSVDFEGDILAESAAQANIASTSKEYYFKFTTSARDDRNLTYPPRLVLDMGDLALNRSVQSAANTTSAYTNVTAMVVDYVYDYINGHTDNQFLSGVDEKRPMKFS